jgi:dynein heavy chain
MLVALQFNYGCSVEGPFGTGKTETVKDLARTIARPIHVINTSINFET